MSGGIAYVLGESLEAVKYMSNDKLVEFELLNNPEEIEIVRDMIERHVRFTGSTYAEGLLAQWSETVRRFVRIVPRDYMRIVSLIEKYRRSGATLEEAKFAAFQTKKQA